MYRNNNHSFAFFFSLSITFLVFSFTLASLVISQSIAFADTGQFSGQFNGNLSLGEKSSDVIALQKLLNEDPTTQLAEDGPGSPGQETDYFGNATQNAVIRFQNKYSAQILTPAGLSIGTGFVGSLTRAELNILIDDASVVSSSSSATSNSAASDVDSNSAADPNVAYFENIAKTSTSTAVVEAESSAITGVYGSTLTLYGSNFTDNSNTIHFTGFSGIDYTIASVPAIGDVKISFAIPETIPLGKYNVWVSNANGSSNKALFFVIITPETVAPAISQVSPQSGPVGTVVTISGSGFSKYNEIRTPYGVIPAQSQDGKIIQFAFSYPNFVQLQQLKNEGKSVQSFSLPIPISIVDDNGITSQKASFTLTIN